VRTSVGGNRWRMGPHYRLSRVMPVEGRGRASFQRECEQRARRLTRSLPTPTNSVQKLQTSLQAKANAEPAFRFYTLWDKVTRADVIEKAIAGHSRNHRVPMPYRATLPVRSKWGAVHGQALDSCRQHSIIQPKCSFAHFAFWPRCSKLENLSRSAGHGITDSPV
jgi:hypothetical protein